MAPTKPTNNEVAKNKPLPNKPETKLPPIPHGSRIHKRPLPGPPPSARPRITPNSTRRSASPASVDTRMAAADPDGYIPTPRAAHTAVIKVSSGASFMSLVRRARKALDKAPGRQNTTGLPLAARVAQLKVGGSGGAGAGGAGAGGAGAGGAGAGGAGGGTGRVFSDALDDVVLVATGRAISKAVDVAGLFTREKDLLVLMRTRSLRAVDDVVAEDEGDLEDEVRVRYLSCLEVGIRWAS